MKNSQASKLQLTFGIEPQCLRILQVGDVMSSMKSLMEFSMINNIPSPMKSMELLIASQKNQQIQAFQAQMAAQAQNLTNFSGPVNLQTDSQRSRQQLINISNNNNNGKGGIPNGSNNNVSSPSPRTVSAEEPKRKRKQSVNMSGENKRRK